MRWIVVLTGLLGAGASMADVVVASQVIRANTIVSANALAVKPGTVPGVFSDPNNVVGLEARISIYPGRPIRLNDVGAPALIDRNQIVTLIYSGNGLSISTEGRSLSRAGAGERARVMNLSSRTTVSGIVMDDGTILVSN